MDGLSSLWIDVGFFCAVNMCRDKILNTRSHQTMPPPPPFQQTNIRDPPRNHTEAKESVSQDYLYYRRCCLFTVLAIGLYSRSWEMCRHRLS